jgi:copper chaperone CopZ
MHRLQVDNLLHIPKMMCDRCVADLASALRAIGGITRIEADLKNRTVRIVSRHYESALLRLLNEAGFPAEPVLRPLG